ncbi:hypothetical protein D9X30_0223 [Cupriavidus sp. U2]|nr:hypothetical protein D9X30_0223 [Cupriavidus sp. U2]
MASRDADAGQRGTRFIADRCNRADPEAGILHVVYDLRVRPAGWLQPYRPT